MRLRDHPLFGPSLALLAFAGLAVGLFVTSESRKAAQRESDRVKARNGTDAVVAVLGAANAKLDAVLQKFVRRESTKPAAAEDARANVLPLIAQAAETVNRIDFESGRGKRYRTVLADFVQSYRDLVEGLIASLQTADAGKWETAVANFGGEGDGLKARLKAALNEFDAKD